MQPSYIEIATLFLNDQRFTVPLFQRPYVWTLEAQWAPLWDDVLDVLRRLESRHGEASVASHFLGTIVLDQKFNATGKLPRREVIDGQQRLTTLQILLKAAEHAIAAAAPTEDAELQKSWSLEVTKVARLTSNTSGGEELYKVWPTNEDRVPFQRVMDSAYSDGVGVDQSRMAHAYRFFRESVATYLTVDDPYPAVQRLVTGLRNYLKLIVLDLETGDEPQAIFETLNAHGTPLLPADLMKNWLLWDAAKYRQDVPKLYDDYWRPFDKAYDYWREKVGSGHTARPRIDAFLQNWLTKETLEQISPKHIYDRFVRFADSAGSSSRPGDGVAEEIMKAIQSDASRFHRIDSPSGNGRFDIFLERLKSLDMSVFHPVLFELMGGTDHQLLGLDRVAPVLESYLVRRMICGMQTRGYGALSIKLLKVLRENTVDDRADLIKDQLLKLDGSDEWPSDEAFHHDWTRKKFYGYFRRERVLMILKALEHHYQTSANKAEPLMTFDWSQLEIEHIMPQSWQQNWPLPDGMSEDERKTRVQGIGNLTLVRKELNASLSNASWLGIGDRPGKRDGLNKHTMMHLNRRLLDQFHGVWNDESIKLRCEALWETAKTIWHR
jgi:hypothetical protein